MKQMKASCIWCCKILRREFPHCKALSRPLVISRFWSGNCGPELMLLDIFSYIRNTCSTAPSSGTTLQLDGWHFNVQICDRRKKNLLCSCKCLMGEVEVSLTIYV